MESCVENFEEVNYSIADDFEIAFEKINYENDGCWIKLNNLEIYYKGKYYNLSNPELRYLLTETDKLTKQTAKIINRVSKENDKLCRYIYCIKSISGSKLDLSNILLYKIIDVVSVYNSFEEFNQDQNKPMICSIQPKRLFNKSNSIHLIHIKLFVELLNSIDLFPKLILINDGFDICLDSYHYNERMDDYSDDYSDEEMFSPNNLKDHTNEVLIYIFSPRLDKKVKDLIRDNKFKYYKNIDDYFVIDSISCQHENIYQQLRFHHFDKNNGDVILGIIDINNSLDRNRFEIHHNKYLLECKCSNYYFRKFLVKKVHLNKFCDSLVKLI